MRKELLVTLLKKDINELAQLTEGFNELDYFPAALLKLAKDKALNINKCLEELGALSTIKKTHVEPTPVAPPAPVKVEPIVVATPIEPVYVEPVVEVEPTVEVIEEECTEEPLQVEAEEIIEPQEVEEIAPETPEEVEEIDECEEDEEEIEEEATPAIHTTRSEAIQNQKVDDIKKAISIGDRFQFQRELFKNSGELLSKTITAINACKSYEDAQRYLQKKFQWDYENPVTERFMQIVARKFD